MQRRSIGRTIRPQVEPLENRTLLATCHVTRLGDFGAGGTIGDMSRGDLRFCITEANDNPGPDTILFSRTGVIKLNSALPVLAGELTLTGPGADMLTVDAQQTARVFTVAAGADVEISGLTMTGGSDAAQGGGIHNDGTLLLSDSAVVGNVVTGGAGSGGLGGGISSTGNLWLRNSTVSENTNDNQYGNGGGIYSTGMLLIQFSQITNNSIPAVQFSGIALGAGIYNSGAATIIHTNISGNHLTGGVIGRGGGLFNDDNGDLTVRSSLVSGNTALSDWAEGGGIAGDSATTTVTNSTVTQNTATNGAGGDIGAFGGGIRQAGGTLIITHCTIVDNHVVAPGGPVPGYGGGVAIFGGTSQIHNTIVAQNDATTGGNDLYGTPTNASFNLIGGDPLLGPLQDNGGPTATMALLPGSPAIDAGDPNPDDAPMFDQRGPGYRRIVNGRLDIGAFEVQATTIPEVRTLWRLM
jgi:hypothetical protein